eukprot:g2191.t1
MVRLLLFLGFAAVVSSTSFRKTLTSDKVEKATSDNDHLRFRQMATEMVQKLEERKRAEVAAQRANAPLNAPMVRSAGGPSFYGGFGPYMPGGMGMFNTNPMYPMVRPTFWGAGHPANPLTMQTGMYPNQNGIMGMNGPSFMAGGQLGYAAPFASPFAPSGVGQMGYPYSGFGIMNPYMQGFGDEPNPNAPPEAGAAA